MDIPTEEVHFLFHSICQSPARYRRVRGRKHEFESYHRTVRKKKGTDEKFQGQSLFLLPIPSAVLTRYQKKLAFLVESLPMLSWSREVARSRQV